MSILQPSNSFKQQQSKAVSAISLFIVVYLLLALGAIAMTGLSIWLALQIIILFPHLITIVLGAGLISMGILVLIFLLKFVFKSKKTDMSHLKEISREDEPRLFTLIDEIVEKTETHFPKRVYLSMDVNAAVFYNSSFWSMFFPVKKNLQIGLGLVNTITEEEFKAILAHEFGHFSQSSMKVGSYVYQVNRAIYDMLYENNDYDRIISNWNSISGYFTPFVRGAVAIARGIQKILQKMYEKINKQHLALSREMEFHADAIAGAITGYQPIATSLMRAEYAQSAYDQTIGFYNQNFNKNWTSDNIYPEQFWVMNFLAKQKGITITENYPQVASSDLNRYNTSKLNIEDQWASHPSTVDRIASVKTYIQNPGIENYAPANLLFDKLIDHQRYFTQKLFDIEYKGPKVNLPLPDFQVEFVNNNTKYTFDTFYNEFYSNKNPKYFEDHSIQDHSALNFESLFSDDRVALIYKEIGITQDLELLKQIKEGTLPLQTFDYDGQKYFANQAAHIMNGLEVEQKNIQQEIKLHDQYILESFLSLAARQNQLKELQDLYIELDTMDQSFSNDLEKYYDLSQKIDFMYYTNTFDDIYKGLDNMKSAEKLMKEKMLEIIDEAAVKDEYTEEELSRMEDYAQSSYKYFNGEKYNQEELDHLVSALNFYYSSLYSRYFMKKKALLDLQVKLLPA